MNILVTGADGFIGKNLVAALQAIRRSRDITTADLIIDDVYLFTRTTPITQLESFCKKTDFVFHFAGVNRSEDVQSFEIDNVSLTAQLLDFLQMHNNRCPIVFSSSVHATAAGIYNTAYGQSKKHCEELLCNYSERTGACVYIYRFPNVFGKWCRPYYNSVVTTFCHQIIHNIPLTIQDPNKELTLLYIDDLVQEMLMALRQQPNPAHVFCRVQPEYKATVADIATILRDFHKESIPVHIPKLEANTLQARLYSTYISYLPADKVAQPLITHSDTRGSFTELIRLSQTGQVSVNTTKPGFTKGNHWHKSKCEVFIAVSGEGLIRQRKLGSQQIIETYISGKTMEAIYILPGYAHSIVNTSPTEDLITLIWANEAFDPENPDTYYEKVTP